MTIYLLVKTHKITGLKYLCQTKQNPFKYRGSGIEWIKHLKQYGNTVDTEIILEADSKSDISYYGRYYSKLWNVVNGQDDFGNKIWANAIPETCGGPGFEGGEKHPNFRKNFSEQWLDKKKKSIVRYFDSLTDEEKKKKYGRSGEENAFYGKHHTEESIRKSIGSRRNYAGEGNPNYGKTHSTKVRKQMSDNHADVSGQNNPRHDPTIYAIENIVTKEIQRLTKYEFRVQYNRELQPLIKGTIKTINGWRIINQA